MFQRVHIQILDNPLEGIIFDNDSAEFDGTNKMLTEELSKELNYSYPSLIFVEYIDLFMDRDGEFDDIMELLRLGAVNAPLVLINGVLKVHGGIPSTIIKKEVEKLLTSGPVH
ncbi:MAG: hypothetical protein AB1610_01235 [Nitrospirota bacterium]